MALLQGFFCVANTYMYALHHIPVSAAAAAFCGLATVYCMLQEVVR